LALLHLRNADGLVTRTLRPLPHDVRFQNTIPTLFPLS
jgi:hypothetical protein